jgi:hypothetical protein
MSKMPVSPAAVPAYIQNGSSEILLLRISQNLGDLLEAECGEKSFSL